MVRREAGGVDPEFVVFENNVCAVELGTVFAAVEE